MTAALAPQGTAVVFGGPGQTMPRFPLEPSMRPVRQTGPRRHGGDQVSRTETCSFRDIGLGARFYITELVGNCMAPAMRDRFAIMDVEADIRRGDLFEFRVRDWQAAFGHYGPDVTASVKRFRGVNRELGFVECECTNPAYIIHTGLTNLLWAHRICATAPTWWKALKLLWRVRLDPGAFDRPLMADE